MSDQEPNLTTPAALTQEAHAALDALGMVKNTKSGLGVASRDRAEAATVADVSDLDEVTLTALWRKSALVKRLCGKPAKVAVSKGVVLATPKGDAAWLYEELARLDALGLGVLARAWGNLYGYCLVAVTIEGQDPSSPLLPGAPVRRVAKLTTYDRHEVVQVTYDDGSLDPSRTGEPLHYAVRAGTQSVTYHASRVFRFSGAPLPRRAKTANSGSDDSVILGPYPALMRFWQAVQALGTMLHDSSVGVWQIKGLSNWINAGNRAAIQTWIETQLLFRGVLGDHALDEGSSFEFKARSLEGAEKIFKSLMDDLAAEVDLPRSELFGVAASGLNASEESDRKKWHESVEKDERPVWTRYLQWLLPILQRQAACPRELRAQSVTISWPPLEVESGKEQDARETAQVDNEVKLVNLGALSPGEVRARLATSPRYTLDGKGANDAAPIRPRPALTSEADALPHVFWLGFRVPAELAQARPPLLLDDSPAHVTLLTWSQTSPDPAPMAVQIAALVDGGAGRMTLGEVASWIGPDGAVVFQRVLVEKDWRMDRLRDEVCEALVQANALPNKERNYWMPHLTLAYLPTPTATWAGARLDGSWWGDTLELWGRAPDGSVRVWATIPLGL